MVIFRVIDCCLARNKLLRKSTGNAFLQRVVKKKQSPQMYEQMMAFDGSENKEIERANLLDMKIQYPVLGDFARGFQNINTTRWYRLSSISNIPKTQRLRLQV